MKTLENYKEFFVEKYTNLPKSKFVNIILIRKTESEAIFRTEGSGEPIVREYVQAGFENSKIIDRSVISKRKQTAVERRTGRELLRQYDLLEKNPKGDICMLNTNAPCEKCADCMIYGFAVGSGGAQKARVITEDAFSILPAGNITDTRTFNALYDNGTMRHPETKIPSTSINSSEYVKPESHYLDIEVLKDVTYEDFIYVLGNIVRSSRYGAMTSKIGRIKNTIAQIIFSDTEVFSTLELTQSVYDLVVKNETDFSLKDKDIIDAVTKSSEKLVEEVIGKYKIMPESELNSLMLELKDVYNNPSDFLKRLHDSYIGV